MGKRLTEYEVIEKAKSIHGNRYLYPNIGYTTGKSEIRITCREHGEFRQVASYHLSGSGCPKCANNIKMDNHVFIKKAQDLHGDRYDYSFCVYRNNKTKIDIRCRKHGLFSQAPSHHLMGVGCPTCNGGFLLNNNTFIMKSRETHGDRYSYDLVRYSTAKQKVKILCKTHGVFLQGAQEHYNGAGCPKCGSTYNPTTAEFIEKARGVHGESYSYDLVGYTNCRDKISIICKVHGVFEQRASDHIKGRGCRKCAKHGFKPHEEAYLYVLIDSDTTSIVKIGITNNLKNRIKQLKSSTPFEFETLDVIRVPGKWAVPVENFYHTHLVNCGFRGFNGATEWFRFDGCTIRAISAMFR